MRVCIVHNAYAKPSGEETVVAAVARLLTDRGHEVARFDRSSAEIETARCGRLRAFFSGIRSPSAMRAFHALLTERRPDVVFVQNVYPLISSGIFSVAARLGIPVVHRCANYRLFCPNGLLFTHGERCERCVAGREYWCVLRNCEGSVPKSLGYAVRNAFNRLTGAIVRHVDLYLVPTPFQKDKLRAWGLPGDRIETLPNFMEIPDDARACRTPADPHVAYAGRISPEKGIATLLEAARRLPDTPFRLAGHWDRMPEVRRSAPPNVLFLGLLDRDGLEDLYAGSRLTVFPSICYETFGMSAIEAMARRRPVVCSRLGSLPDIVTDGETGLLFEAGNADDLAAKIRRLWDDPALCRRMGEAARARFLARYTPEAAYPRLMKILERAIALQRAGRP